MNKNNQILLVFYIVISGLLWGLGLNYAAKETNGLQQQIYLKEASTITSRLETLITEKHNATMALAISAANNGNSKPYLNPEEQGLKKRLEQLSLQLRDETDFKNVWIQFIDKNGVAVASSGTDKKGRNLSQVREDVRQMIRNPRAMSTISVGQYDLSFKAMVPVFVKNSYSGHIELITHFNSIAKKLTDEGYSPLFIVKPELTQKIQFPFTKIFLGEHYIANQNADPDLITLVEDKGVAHFSLSNNNYLVDKESGFLTAYSAIWQDEEILADVLLFKPLDSINDSVIDSAYVNTILLLILANLIISIIFYGADPDN